MCTGSVKIGENQIYPFRYLPATNSDASADETNKADEREGYVDCLVHCESSAEEEQVHKGVSHPF